MNAVTLLRDALEALRIDSPTSYSWYDRPAPRLVPELRRALTPAESRGYLLNVLTSGLYADFYLRGKAKQSVRDAGQPWQHNQTAFQAELSAANSGIGYWEGDWHVRSVSGNMAVVWRDGLQMAVSVHDCGVHADFGKPGTHVSVRFPNELLRMSPGFYMALGDKPLSASAGRIVVRLYWNLTAEGAVPFVRAATKRLNEAGVAFRLKVLSDPELFSRCDAAVIYLPREDYQRLDKVMTAIYSTVREHLKPDIPVFTKGLAQGVGLAEDPANGDSFGMSRCRLVASGVVHAYESGKRTTDERLNSVEECFDREGLSLHSPFLSSGSTDGYPPLTSDGAPIAPRSGNDSGMFLSAATEIGRRLTREAFWHEDRCTWLAPEPDSGQTSGSANGLLYRTLGPDLYSGTGGVALFLAELCAACEDQAIRRTALGAIWQAAAQASALPPKSRLGLYSGGIGVAFAMARVATLLDSEELLNGARQLLQECTRETVEGREYDLLSGDAGAIVGLLALRKLLADDSLVEVAARLGDELLAAADSSGPGLSWRSIGFHNRRNLTGLSHGAAGAGVAFLELFQETGDRRYSAGAEGAFEYERCWYVAAKRNWPDFRDPGHRVQRASPTPVCSTFWCHGAPGIALSRLRAFEVLGREIYREEAVVALETTSEMVEESLRSGDGNFSLCHGLTGNAEIVLSGQEFVARASTLAVDTAAAGIDRSKRQAGRWVCGAGPVETQSLLLGLAGIGYFFLRLRNQSIPSILLLRPSASAQ